jgi:hypothetical protein
VRDLPVGLPEEIMAIIRRLPAINNRFNEHLETVTLYRPALGASFEGCWVELLDFIKKLVGQISNVTKGTWTLSKRHQSRV